SRAFGTSPPASRPGPLLYVKRTRLCRWVHTNSWAGSFVPFGTYARVCVTMRKLRVLLAVSCILCLNLLGSHESLAQTKRGVTPEDYLSFRFAGDPHLSPDGKVVAYVVTVIDQKKNRRDS